MEDVKQKIDLFALKVLEVLRESLKERYEFLEVLGRGTSSLVARVQNLTLKRFEALKVLFHVAEESMERFRREAQLVATLDHPHIAKVYSFGESAGYPWYTMQLIEGPSLAQFVRTNGKLEPRLALALALPILDALDYAHGLGIVHRDIKPANIMLNQSFKPFLVDFGLAKQLGGAELTQTGFTVGTPAYIAPEQVLGVELDRRADIYSLSATLYEVLSGRLPFLGSDPVHVALARVTGDPQPLQEVSPDCPPELAAVVMRGLRRDPQERFASAAEMAVALQEACPLGEEVEPPVPQVLARARPAPVDVETALTAVLPRESSPPMRGRLLLVLLLLAAVIPLGALVFLPLKPARRGTAMPVLPSTTTQVPIPPAQTPTPLPTSAPSPTPTAAPTPQAPEPEPPKNIPRAVQPPEPLGSTVIPLGGAAADRCAGTRASLAVSVNADGSVSSVRILKVEIPECTEYAVQAVKVLRWRPAQGARGEYVEGRAAVVIEFSKEADNGQN
ncbi:MAG: protein kinase domain-containing protein [Thermoanaerobaculaceae bacterium]